MNKICLIGFGKIGKKIFLIDKTKKRRISIIILKINNRRYKKKIDSKIEYKKIFIFNKIKFIFLSKKINTVIELIGDNYTSKKILCYCLIYKKILITANKKLINTLIYKLLKYINTNIFIEASVCGGIPIFGILKNNIKKASFIEIETIVNGTTNFILDMIFNKNKSYEQSINNAIKKGLSELNPNLDLKGVDSSNKISIIHKILSNNKNIKIQTYGINKIKNYIKTIKKTKMEIKLLSLIKKKKNLIQIETNPYLIKKKNILHKIKREENILQIKTKEIKKLTLIGKGAGKYPTAWSIFSDIEKIKKKPKIFNTKKTNIYCLNIINKKILMIKNKNIKNLIKYTKLIKIKTIIKKNKKQFILITINKINNKRINLLKRNQKKVIIFKKT